MIILLKSKKNISYDTDFYRNLWLDSFREIWEFFAPENYFEKSEIIYSKDINRKLF